MKPSLRNHIVIDQPETVIDLIILLAKEKSIYFAPLNRVLPTAFFKGYLWGIPALSRHLEAGNFWRTQRKDIAMRLKIRKLLSEMPKI